MSLQSSQEQITEIYHDNMRRLIERDEENVRSYFDRINKLPRATVEVMIAIETDLMKQKMLKMPEE